MANWADKLFVCVGIPSMVIYTGLSAYSLIWASSTDDKRRDAVIRQAAKYREMRKQQDGERIDNRRDSS